MFRVCGRVGVGLIRPNLGGGVGGVCGLAVRRASFTPDVQTRLDNMVQGIKDGNRIQLSKAITLIESTRVDHSLQADYVLEQVAKHVAAVYADKDKIRLRIAISGPPGVGKSTFIEALGTHLVNNEGLKVAVTAVDPSSAESGGSILGDKTRMPILSSHPSAYIRPSPTRGSLGGVTRDTSEVILLCQGAGFDVNIIETVGVGQSEVVATDMADVFVVLVPPASGDDLQGIKRGIMEMADLIVVTKADGSLLFDAERVAADYRWALKLQRQRYKCWSPKVLKSSVQNTTTTDAIWRQILKFRGAMMESGDLALLRQKQHTKIMWSTVDSELCRNVRLSAKVKALLAEISPELATGSLTPRRAAHRVVSVFSGEPDPTTTTKN